MKIVDVCAFYSTRGGGVRTYIDRKLVAGPLAGHEVTVIAPGPVNRIEDRGPGARIVWLASPRFPLDRNYHYFADPVALYQALDDERPDVIEASSPWRSASMVARWPGRAQRALIMHADPLAAFAYRWFEGLASRRTVDRSFDWYWRHLLRLDRDFDVVVSASQSLSERLAAGGLRRVVTNPMGIDPGVFSPTLRDEAFRAQLLARCDLGSDATLLLGVGRHAPEKRWPMIVEAVMSASYERPIGLVLVGEGRDGARIRRQVGGNPHIVLLPTIAGRPELARLMASADALVHGCEAETFCIVAAEARASGLTLITPDRGGAADHSRAANGYRYISANAASAAEAIGRFADRPRLPRQAPLTGLVPPRTMDCHFDMLFAGYTQLIDPMREAA
ncbi:MAG: glycosyltransferase [Janthinobacterium lividum]